jgi:hypothetical protein
VFKVNTKKNNKMQQSVIKIKYYRYKKPTKFNSGICKVTIVHCVMILSFLRKISSFVFGFLLLKVLYMAQTDV